jgi:hypothetical protein
MNGTTSGPTLAGFQTFLQNELQASAKELPPGSGVIPMALAVAMAIVNPALQQMAIPSTDAAGVALNAGNLTIYTLAVYNLATSNVINYAQDQQGYTFFKRLRKKLNINGFVSGVVQSSSDEGTSVSLVVQEAAKMFTLANLQTLKDPWGRQYLAMAQTFGPATWGMT